VGKYLIGTIISSIAAWSMPSCSKATKLRIPSGKPLGRGNYFSLDDAIAAETLEYSPVRTGGLDSPQCYGAIASEADLHTALQRFIWLGCNNPSVGIWNHIHGYINPSYFNNGEVKDRRGW
jgi:hypothetical protein